MGYYISQKDWDKIINYAKAAYGELKTEIGGMSICYKDKDGDWVVTDPVILKQQVTGGTCDLDKEALADYYCHAAKKHAKKQFRFCWWHSHHTMGVFWSSTDLKGIQEYSDGDLSFALVVNLKEESKFRVSVWKPVVAYQDVELQIMGTEKNVPKKILAEVKELCNTRTYTPEVTTYKNGKKQNVSSDQLDMYGSYGWYDDQVYDARVDKVYSTSMFIEKDYTQCFDKVFEWMDLLLSGDLTYEQYEKDIVNFNDALLKAKSKYRCELIKRSDLTPEALSFGDPADWVEPVGWGEIRDKERLLHANNGKV